MEGGRINWAFIKRARWLYLVFQGDTRAEKNDNEIDNKAFLQILVYLKDYLKQNKLALGEAIAQAGAMAEGIKEKLEDYKNV